MNEQNERPEITPVVSGVTKIAKKTLGSKIKDLIFPGSFEDRKNYIIKDVAVPTVKRLLLNLVEASLFGKTNITNGLYNPISYNRPFGTSINYSGTYYGTSPYGTTNYNNPQAQKPQQSPIPDFMNIDYSLEKDAEAVKNAMVDILNRFGKVKVSELCELSRVPCPYTLINYGWLSLDGAHVHAKGNGMYGIKLPNPVPLF